MGVTLQLAEAVLSKCGDPRCDRGGVPCDCTTKAGKPRTYCQMTRSAWLRSHPCPVCCAPDARG